MKKVIIVGSLNMDLTINAPYMPQGGETLTGSGFMTNGGGKGANQAAACAKLGGNVYMCGCVGDDEFGKQMVDNLKSFNVNCDYIRTVKDCPSGIAVIVVTNGENRIILDKGANAHLSKADIDKVLEIAEEGDIYLTQLENPIEIIGYGLEQAKKKGLYVVLNPAPANNSIMPYLTSVDLITPNQTELEILCGKQVLFDNGIEKIVTTLGGSGYEIADKNDAKQYPCIKIKPVDTTAAGDTLCGGMCAKLSQGASLEEAVAFGSKSATIACTRKGAAQSIPTLKEVEDFKA